MLAKIQERYYFFLALTEAIGIVLFRGVRTLHDRLDILLAAADLFFDVELLKNKLYAILLIACTLPITLLESDATATVFVAMFAVPMFFAKKPWIL